MKFFDLPFYNGLFRTFEAMQYSVSDYNAINENSSDYSKQNNEYWLKRIRSTADGIKDEVLKFSTKNVEEINKNPLILGLIQLCLEASEVNTRDEFKKIYEKYIKLQKEYKFEDHKKEYFDAGCCLATGYLEESNDIKVCYPLFLYGAYTEHGGKDDDYRGGYLYPVHVLSIKELKELYKMDPKLFESEKVQNLYKKIEDVENN